MKIWIHYFSRKIRLYLNRRPQKAQLPPELESPVTPVWLNDSVCVSLLGLQRPRMPTAEVLCTHQGVSQSRGKSIGPAQGSPVLVINNPDLKCGYCFQRVHQLQKQKNTQNYPFLLSFMDPKVCF